MILIKFWCTDVNENWQRAKNSTYHICTVVFHIGALLNLWKASTRFNTCSMKGLCLRDIPLSHIPILQIQAYWLANFNTPSNPLNAWTTNSRLWPVMLSGLTSFCCISNLVDVDRIQFLLVYFSDKYEPWVDNAQRCLQSVSSVTVWWWSYNLSTMRYGILWREAMHIVRMSPETYKRGICFAFDGRHKRTGISHTFRLCSKRVCIISARPNVLHSFVFGLNSSIWDPYWLILRRYSTV